MTTPRESRRSFLKKSAAATLLATADFAALGGPAAAGLPPAARPDTAGRHPWYRRTLRWGQTNITEIDAERYDIAWWRQHWKRTCTQGVIINAGGIVASYPSKFPLHHRAAGLHDRDLFGDITRAAHDDGLVVMARMDSNRVHEEFFRAHPDWIARDARGEPYRIGDFFIPCVNSPYYDEVIPDILREIIRRSHPEGFGDNNWNGLDRNQFCYCENCRRKFRDEVGGEIPRRKDWDDPQFRKWVEWSYARRTGIWDLNNRATREAGGPECLWIGMNSGSLPYQGLRFRDTKAICERSELFLLDDQMRRDPYGFQHNGEIGKMIHGLLGWDKLIPESMAMYQMSLSAPYRLASKPEPEARLWMLEGIAATVQPWWHHLGAFQEDRRMFQTAEPILRWHQANQEFLINREPVASVGLVWSQQNTDFFGRDHADELTELPWRGWTNALVRARIPYLPVHADHIARDAHQLSALILPNLAVMSPSQVESVRQFVVSGGGLIATGQSSRCNEWGDPLSDFALADLFGAHVHGDSASFHPDCLDQALNTHHTYLRLIPATASQAYGPSPGAKPASLQTRHPVLEGFDDTDILAFGGRLAGLRVDNGVVVPATFIPEIPVFPPERVWLPEHAPFVPALVIPARQKGRVAYLAADIDRRYGRDNLPDHGRLLANLVGWAAKDNVPLRVAGPGFVDCHLYRQSGRLVLHLVNLTNAGTWRGPVHELIQVGPLAVQVKLPGDVRGERARLLVSNDTVAANTGDGWIRFVLPTVLDHEVAVID